MPIPLRLMFVSKLENGVTLMLRELRRAGYNPAYVRVDAAATMVHALEREAFDLVIVEDNIPTFGPMAALELLRRRQLELPAILVLGGTGAENAAAAVKTGAQDYVGKKDLTRLPLVVARELREAQACQERRLLEKRLEASEELLRSLVDSVEGYAIFMLDLQGLVTTWNKGAERITGYGVEEVLDENFSLFYTREDAVEGKPQQGLMEAAEKGRFEEEGLRVRKDGSTFWASVVIAALRDEDGKLRGFSTVTHDVTERKRTEKELHDSLEALLTIYEAGQILGSTLETEEVGSRLLRLMQRISSSVTAVISVPDQQQQLRVWRSIGFENLWRRARYTSEVQATLAAVMRSGDYMSATLTPPDHEARSLVGLFLPLRIRNRTIGVLEVYGPRTITNRDVIDILLNLTTKAASALENARLYGELAERERQLQELVGKLMVTQEEERRRVAYEVHDGPTQVAVAAYQHLQAFARDYPPDTPDGRAALERTVEFARRSVGESRQIIANLRPTALDDFGLSSAIRLLVEALRADGLRVSYEENVGSDRLPDPIETALYRAAQEALTNVRKHARTTQVRVKLSRTAQRVRLRIRDWGQGFGVTLPTGGGPGERVGLAGMRERIALVGGELRLYSKEGVGTLIVADVLLAGGEVGDNGELGRGLIQRLTRPGVSSAGRIGG